MTHLFLQIYVILFVTAYKSTIRAIPDKISMRWNLSIVFPVDTESFSECFFNGINTITNRAQNAENTKKGVPNSETPFSF
jgi:hypothetical protein